MSSSEQSWWWQWRPAAAAVAFAAVLFVLELGAFQGAYVSVANGVHYLSVLRDAPSLKWQLLQAGLIIGSLAGFIAFVYAALVASTPWKVVHLLVFAAACLVEYSIHATLGRPSDASDVRQFILVNDSAALWQGAGLFLQGTALLPVAAFAGVLVLVRGTPGRWSGVRFVAVMSAISILYYSAAHVPPWVVVYRDYLKYPLPAFNGVFRSLADFTRESASAWDTRRAPVPPVEHARPSGNIVLIIDESIRGDRLSLNGYPRDTTPFLVDLERRGQLQNWGLASSLATCSNAAHAMLMTGMGLEDLPATWAKVRGLPTVFQYAKAAGYRTHYFDGSMKVLWSLGPHDMPFVDEWRGAGTFAAPPDTDTSVAFAVRDVLAGPPGQFIWVTKVGAHFNYDQRFPPATARWHPYTRGRDTSGGVAAMGNAYDAALRYNLEEFFRALLPDGVATPGTRILYTSDHAESIVADIAREAPHCGMAREQAVVPLFLIGYDQPLDLGFRPSHVNVFATVLDLMGVPATHRQRAYGPSLLTATRHESAPRFFAGPFLSSTSRLPFD